MALERKKTLNVFKDVKEAWGSYDDFPVGPKGTDPMPHLSRNRVRQPFFLVSEQDQVLIQMAGEGSIELKEIEPSFMRLTPGDTVYIPAGVPTRLTPEGDNIQIRLKVDPPAREAAAFYCDPCGELIYARAIEGDREIPQQGYWEAAQAWNADEGLRRCPRCAAVGPPVDLADIAWPAVAAALANDDRS